MMDIEADWQQKKKDKAKEQSNLNNLNQNQHEHKKPIMGGGIMSKISNMISNDMKELDLNIDLNTNNNEDLEKIMQRNKIQSSITQDKNQNIKTNTNHKSDYINNQLIKQSIYDQSIYEGKNMMNKTG